MATKQTIVTGLFAASIILASGPVCAAGQYGPGVTDTEIKIGNIMPYSGPASAYGAIGKAEAAYFAMINDQGGINGRKINFISRDDGYSPPKTVEMARQLVERRRGTIAVQSARHTDQFCDPGVHERTKSAATVRQQRGRKVQRSQALSLDDGLAFNQAIVWRRPPRSLYPQPTCQTPKSRCSTRMTM